ncbi:MAG: TerB family tellurite resistance protein [Rhodospirillaceae bacterium]|nr:TerB family tellurite resistance protein [Rhodospirillaceae bacterium]
MSIWGKILGGTAGLAIGGPIGAILGVAAGHVADRTIETFSGRAPNGRMARQIAFTTAVIVLGAKMAKADGVVTRDEVAAFKEVFHVPPGDAKNVGRLFDIAKKDAAGYEPYARQLKDMFMDQPAMLDALLDALFHIAKADGTYHPGERMWLKKVSDLFGFDSDDFRRIEAKHTVRPQDDPYAVLGIEPTATDEEARSAWRAQVREHHPDKLIAEGLPQEFVDTATRHLANINAAWDAIAKERGLT